MIVASWNVNSLKVRLPQLLDWLARVQPDVVCLQETKLEDAAFPAVDIAAAGYQVAFSGQKTYNGVAVLARGTLGDVQYGNPFHADPQKRLLLATVAGVQVICAYVPNGQAVDSEKYTYKLAWLDALARWVDERLAVNPRLVLAGDFNIAPDDRDVHDPQAWAGQILCSDAERAAFRRLLAAGLHDSFRLFEQPAKAFSWWDYRMLAFQKNQGLRIDHILLSAPLASRCTAATIHRETRKLTRPSDHAPVSATFTVD
ncbi:MAG TPA: exodeoxyribonuclease III [Accumulibacter sp.]|nr:exodeoxyribonuclease III [Accumulibacter sp.]HMW19088.1 exodeoxyribonuclease III [Accumulibacter sp.]HMX23562.1 exodeoxyribonuclease III [Accumulibacter sp.]HNC17710.1 exodeoxyribonuclease III [Accumulibacter sp.]HND80211.1 exodeoxyribonuclease III [Accumulibacter sp.]